MLNFLINSSLSHVTIYNESSIKFPFYCPIWNIWDGLQHFNGFSNFLRWLYIFRSCPNGNFGLYYRLKGVFGLLFGSNGQKKSLLRLIEMGNSNRAIWLRWLLLFLYWLRRSVLLLGWPGCAVISSCFISYYIWIKNPCRICARFRDLIVVALLDRIIEHVFSWVKNIIENNTCSMGCFRSFWGNTCQPLDLNTSGNHATTGNIRTHKRRAQGHTMP